MSTAAKRKIAKQETPTESFVRLCRLSASHCSAVMTMGAPGVMRCGIGDDVYRVTIKVSNAPRNDNSYHTQTLPNGSTVNIWDSVWIALDSAEGDGTWCGNRNGGRDALSQLYATTLLSAAENV